MPAKATAKLSPAEHAERAKNSYKQLSEAATRLNSASDDLGEAVSVFDAALQRLNLGVSAWVQTSGGGDEELEWWGRYIGYSKIGKEWGICLKEASGNYSYPDRDTEEKWRFNDAPRWMRVESVGKIVDLFEALIKQAEDTTSKLKARAEEALTLAGAMSEVLNEPAGQK